MICTHGGHSTARCVALQVVCSGTGRFLGMEVAWQRRSRSDGAFLDTVSSPDFSTTWGYSGHGAGSQAWEVRRSCCPQSSVHFSAKQLAQAM